MWKVFLFLAAVTASLLSCRPARAPAPSAENENSDSIAFLVFRISKDSVQKKNTLELISKKKTAGKIKNEDPSPVAAENFLSFEYFRYGKLVNTITMEHPLYKRMEYSENNVLTSKSIELTNEEFFIRMQLKGAGHKIRVLETLKRTNTKELTTINL